jgi:hypothetical protein
MEGGGAAKTIPTDEGSFKLGDISDYREINDFRPIASATLVGINLTLLLARFGGLGGISLNTYFDAFGLEGILSNMSLVVILMQAARWGYTKFYNPAGSKPWSPFIFVCILIGVQMVHDMLFYYGAINALPSGVNEMVDVLKGYAKENGTRALSGHAVFLIVVAVISMFLKETSLLFSFVVVSIAFYLLPYIITTLGPKKPAPAPPPKEEEKKPAARKEEFMMPAWAQGGLPF